MIVRISRCEMGRDCLDVYLNGKHLGTVQKCHDHVSLWKIRGRKCDNFSKTDAIVKLCKEGIENNF